MIPVLFGIIVWLVVEIIYLKKSIKIEKRISEIEGRIKYIKEKLVENEERSLQIKCELLASEEKIRNLLDDK